jgi:hypothetical protein
MEEDEVVIEEEMEISIPRLAVRLLLSMLLSMDMVDMDNRCLIQCSLSTSMFRCMDGLLLLHHRLLFLDLMWTHSGFTFLDR